MKKNRLIAAALVAAVTTTSLFSTNVYARKYYLDETNTTTPAAQKIGTGAMPSIEEGTALTVDAAVERAIERSSTIKSYEDNIDITQESMKDVRQASRDATEFNIINGYAVSYKSLEMQVSNYRDKIEAEKQTIRYNVENYFATILLAQDSLAIYDETLDVATRNLEITKKQLELGMISQNTYDQALDTYNETVTKKTTLENTVSSCYTALNTLLEYNVAATYDVTVDDLITYEPLDRNTLSAHVALATSTSNVNIKVLERSVELAKYNLSLYSDLYSTDSELEKEAAVYTATSSLNNTKLSYEAAIKTLYQNILETEDSLTDYNNRLTTLQNTMAIYEKQFELGQITQLQLDNYKLEEKQLAINIQSAENTHYFYMQQYNNPNLI